MKEGEGIPRRGMPTNWEMQKGRRSQREKKDERRKEKKQKTADLVVMARSGRARARRPKLTLSRESASSELLWALLCLSVLGSAWVAPD